MVIPMVIPMKAGAGSEPATGVTPMFRGSSQSRKRFVACVPLSQATENFP
jgi:hypothetical protein